MLSCTYCAYSTRHFVLLCRHYRNHHSDEPHFKVKCIDVRCTKTLKSVRCLQRHVKSRHKWQLTSKRNFQHIACPVLTNCETEVNNSNIYETEDVNGTEVNNLEQDDHEQNLTLSKDDSITNSLAKVLLNSINNSKISKQSLFVLCESLISVSLSSHNKTIEDFKKALHDSGVEVNENPLLKTALEKEPILELAWSKLNSSDNLDKYLEGHLNYVKPVEIVLGESQNNKRETLQYVPVIETIRYLLQFQDVLNDVKGGHKSQDNVLRDICDGYLVRDHPLFSQDKDALQIIFYLDEVNFVNPLGNKVSQHKIYAFYMQLANVHPSQRSSHESVQLVLLCKSKYVKKYGFASVLEPFITDVKKLETEGEIFETKCGPVNLKGSILCCIADNLAAHSIGGFKESFSSGKCCRFCLIDKKDLASVFVGTPRTKENYNCHCTLVEEFPPLSNVYGIKGTSCLNELSYYHVVDGLPPDITHDIFEGVAKYILSNVLSYCINQKFFSLQYLNKCIEQFKYVGSDNVNKPHTLSSSVDIKQTASQTWCLLRIVSLMVGHCVPLDDSKWDVLLKLLDIIEIISMQDIEVGQVYFLNELIEDFSQQYTVEFPDEIVKPKFHFLHHYSELTLKFGPLVHCWSLRFEGKHNWFKQVFKSSKCFKNIPKTLAKRHQCMLASLSGQNQFYHKSWFDVIGGKVRKLSHFSEAVQDLIRIKFGNIGDIYEARSFRICGSLYTKGCCFPSGIEGDLITFAEIKNCFLISDKPYCLLHSLKTVNYSKHLHAYKVVSGECLYLNKLSKNLKHAALGVYNIPSDFNHKFVALKSKILL